MTEAEVIASLPSSVRIGAFDLSIIPVTVLEANSRNVWGTCNTTMQEIKIQKEFPSPQKAVDTFLHECLHAIMWAYFIEAGEKGDSEERLCSMFASALVALHRDNPWLAGWIAAALA